MNQPTRFEAPREEHPFAGYVRILGKGKSGSRSLDQEEAREAFRMILMGEAEPMQVGAFLMLLRVKEETGAELAGFVQACRDTLLAPPPGLVADLDWSSYAGKRHQHPWFLLAALLLAQAGYRVFIHGSDGHTEGRLYTEEAMIELGLPVAANWRDVASQLDSANLSYLPLRNFCLPLHDLLQLRPLLGLRSPVNTLARILNPLRADSSLRSIFHPAYATLHQETDQLLGQPRSLVLKGDSGEVEIKPQANTRLQLLAGDQQQEITLPRTLAHKALPVAAPAAAPLATLWRGETDDEYGSAAVIGTAAAALLVLRPSCALDEAQAEATRLWQQRDLGRLS